MILKSENQNEDILQFIEHVQTCPNLHLLLRYFGIKILFNISYNYIRTDYYVNWLKKLNRIT